MMRQELVLSGVLLLGLTLGRDMSYMPKVKYLRYDLAWDMS